MWKWKLTGRKRKIVMTMLITAIAIDGAWLFWMVGRTVYYRGKVKEEIRLFLAEGGAMRLVDLAPEPISEGEDNPALVIEEVYSLTFVPDYDREKYVDRYVSPEEKAECESQNRSAPIQIVLNDPAIPQEAKMARALDRFEKWDGFRKTRSVLPIDHSGKPIPPQPWRKAWVPCLDEYLAANEDLLPMVREAAEKGFGVFSADWDKGINFFPNHLRKVRNASKLLQLDAVLRAHGGNVAGAIDDVRSMLRLRRLIDDEPDVMSKTTAMQLDAKAFSTLQGIFEFGAPDRDDAAKLLKELDGRESANSMVRPLLGETAEWIQLYEEPGDEEWPLCFAWLSPGIQAMRAASLRMMRLGRDMARLPRYKVSKDSIDTEDLPYIEKDWSLTFSLQMMTYRKASIASARADAWTGMARTALALVLYKAENGAYPETLDALVPECLPKIQTDPCSGKPLCYKLTDYGCAVYSFDIDGDDDDGRAEPGESDNDRDLVWELYR
jgi:hypothetical protein